MKIKNAIRVLKMSIYYHVDRSNSLFEGQNIDLSCSHLSKFGQSYWRQFTLLGIEEISDEYKSKSNLLDKSAYREFWLELFRKEDPMLQQVNCPSRLNSFFVFEKLEEYKIFSQISSSDSPIKNDEYSIFEIHSEQKNPKFLDMAWLDFDFPKDYTKFGYYYRNYWLGKKISDDTDMESKYLSKIEILLNEPIIVGKKISLSK